MPLVLDKLGSKAEYDYIFQHPTHEDVKFYCKTHSIAHDFALVKKHSGKVSTVNGEEVKEDTDILAIGRQRFSDMIVKWEGLEDAKGKPLECTEENKFWFFDRYGETLCKDIEKFIKRQVAAEVGLNLGN